MIRPACALGCLVGLAAQGEAATLVVRAEGIASDSGVVNVGVCPTSFDRATCTYKDRMPAKAGVVEFRIRNVRPGRYAIAIYHDVNGNGEFDRGLLGIPMEPYGLSNDEGRLGMPDFERALIDVREPTTTVTVSVR